MESKFGTDFGNVNVHTDNKAVQMARDLNAQAFTTGNDIYFNEGMYNPGSQEGKHLLAHELTHTVQQSGPGPAVSPTIMRQTVKHGTHKGTTDKDDVKTKANDIYEVLGKKKVVGGSGVRHSGTPLLTTSPAPPGGERPPMTFSTMPPRPKKPKPKPEHKLSASEILKLKKILEPMNRDPAKIGPLKDEYLKDFGNDLANDVRAALKGTDELYDILYLLNAPPTMQPSGPVNVMNLGTPVPTGDSDVVFSTGVDYQGRAERDDGFSVAYKGDRPGEARFIQTVWMEALSTRMIKKADGTWDNYATYVVRLTNDNATVPPTMNNMGLTADTSKPNYKVDVHKAKTPFYDETGMHARTKDAIVNCDHPEDWKPMLDNEVWQNGAKEIIQIAHFDNFLIKDGKPVFQFSHTVVWIYRRGPGGVTAERFSKSTNFGSGTKITALPPAVRDQVLSEFPDFDYIR